MSTVEKFETAIEAIPDTKIHQFHITKKKGIQVHGSAPVNGKRTYVIWYSDGTCVRMHDKNPIPQYNLFNDQCERNGQK